MTTTAKRLKNETERGMSPWERANMTHCNRRRQYISCKGNYKNRVAVDYTRVHGLYV